MSEQRSQPNILKLTRFGNPILREAAQRLTVNEIRSATIQRLIRDISHTNSVKKLGVGLAAPQVGLDVALAMIDIKPSKTRPDAPTYFRIIINPSYEGIRRRAGIWEGCLSSGHGSNVLFAKALRFRKIKASWLDENGMQHEEELEGIIAHVFQHETDHLNGILFVDRVRDSKTYMLADEYKKRIVGKSKDRKRLEA